MATIKERRLTENLMLKHKKTTQTEMNGISYIKTSFIQNVLSCSKQKQISLQHPVQLIRDVGVVTTRTQSNEFRVVTSSNEYLSPRNIVTEYLCSND